jgi:hypothetical protein
MNHSDAIKEMAAERYLLDELSPDVRDAFEEHMFDCTECALDVRSGSAFIGEAKAQLPGIGLGSPAANKTAMPREKNKQWFAWLRPAFAVPVLATLLLVVGYQNLVTLPALHNSVNQPRIAQVAPLYGATRGSSHASITADRVNGIALPIDVPLDSAAGNYISLSFELSNAQGKVVWKSSIQAPPPGANPDLQLSVVLPGSMLENGTYALTVSGGDTHGGRNAIGRYVFDVVLSK